MKIIKPSVEFFGAVPTDYENTLRFIEMAGRTCYRSEDKITAGSAEGFVKRLIKSGHLAMVEHSNFVVRLTDIMWPDFCALQGELGPFLKVFAANGGLWVGGNITAWYQRFVLLHQDDELCSDPEVFTPFINTFGGLFLIGEDDSTTRWQVCPHNEIPTELHRYSAKFICDRGVSHELVRHRPCSFAQESTRYVNYGGKDLEFIEPADWEKWRREPKKHFTDACDLAEELYNLMLENGLKPQQARAVLPNALKTEIVTTCDIAEWRHIHKLRSHPSAHPDIQRVVKLWEEAGGRELLCQI